MTEIDLSKYVGKEVICTLSDGKTLSGFVSIFDHCGNYPYMVDGWTFTITGKGYSKSQIESIQLKNPMTEIDLSKYVGKEVICTFDMADPICGFVSKNQAFDYPYSIVRRDKSVYVFSKTGKGFSRPQIESIQLKNPMIGIAQKHPNINLEDFEDQRCYVKWSDGRGSIGTIRCSSNYWDICGSHSLYNKDGTNTHSKNAQVKEIYGEGAYEITTKDTFDAPSTDAVEKATEALKDLTEEQIAKVLHALKGKSN